MFLRNGGGGSGGSTNAISSQPTPAVGGSSRPTTKDHHRSLAGFAGHGGGGGGSGSGSGGVGGGGGGGGGGGSDKPGPEVQDIRIVVLGASGVGKTCLVQQFVHCSCPDVYSRTRKPAVYHPSITVNEHCYDARIVDCPALRYFPTDSLQEFSDFRGYGLRSASGYVLVYDISDEASFAHIRSIRESIQEQGIDVPILVAANKADLLVANGRLDKEGGGGGVGASSGKDKGSKEARRETSNLVRKQWKCLYVECSAKYNWHVGSAFRELLKAIDHKDFGHKPTSARVQEALRRNQCCVM